MTTVTTMDRTTVVSSVPTTTTISAVPSLTSPKAKAAAATARPLVPRLRSEGRPRLGPWVASIVAISQRMRTSIGWSLQASSTRGVGPDARGRGVDMVDPRVESAGMRMTSMISQLGERSSLSMIVFFSYSLLLS